MDNEDAEIEVGDEIPVGSSTATTGSTTTTSQERRPITIKLKIKPHISPGSNMMRLEINQHVQDLSSVEIKATALSGQAIATSKRSTITNVMVRDGDTIVLGGLMRDKEDITMSKVPLLGDIPILGWLFKGKRTQKTKINLLNFLTPRIIRNKEQNTNLLMQKLKQRTDFIEQNVGGKDSQGSFLNSLQLQKDGKPIPNK